LCNLKVFLIRQLKNTFIFQIVQFTKEKVKNFIFTKIQNEIVQFTKEKVKNFIFTKIQNEIVEMHEKVPFYFYLDILFHSTH